MTTVNEPGLYSLILGSRKPEAKRFKRWVTHEVLPAIRRTGRYALPGAAEPQLPQQAPALPPAGPCIVIQASSYREAAQAWAEALEGAAVGAIRRRFSTVSRPGNLLPAGVHFMPLQA
jgi:prophage antirepressor-like protein